MFQSKDTEWLKYLDLQNKMFKLCTIEIQEASVKVDKVVLIIMHS